MDAIFLLALSLILFLMGQPEALRELVAQKKLRDQHRTEGADASGMGLPSASDAAVRTNIAAGTTTSYVPLVDVFRNQYGSFKGSFEDKYKKHGHGEQNVSGHGLGHKFAHEAATVDDDAVLFDGSKKAKIYEAFNIGEVLPAQLPVLGGDELIPPLLAKTLESDKDVVLPILAKLDTLGLLEPLLQKALTGEFEKELKDTLFGKDLFGKDLFGKDLLGKDFFDHEKLLLDGVLGKEIGLLLPGEDDGRGVARPLIKTKQLVHSSGLDDAAKQFIADHKDEKLGKVQRVAAGLGGLKAEAVDAVGSAKGTIKDGLSLEPLLASKETYDGLVKQTLAAKDALVGGGMEAAAVATDAFKGITDVSKDRFSEAIFGDGETPLTLTHLDPLKGYKKTVASAVGEVLPSGGAIREALTLDEKPMTDFLGRVALKTYDEKREEWDDKLTCELGATTGGTCEEIARIIEPICGGSGPENISYIGKKECSKRASCEYYDGAWHGEVQVGLFGYACRD